MPTYLLWQFLMLETAAGVATVFNDVLAITTVSTGNDVFNIIPGQGILAQNGVRVFLESSVPANHLLRVTNAS